MLKLIYKSPELTIGSLAGKTTEEWTYIFHVRRLKNIVSGEMQYLTRCINKKGISKDELNYANKLLDIFNNSLKKSNFDKRPMSADDSVDVIEYFVHRYLQEDIVFVGNPKDETRTRLIEFIISYFRNNLKYQVTMLGLIRSLTTSL